MIGDDTFFKSITHETNFLGVANIYWTLEATFNENCFDKIDFLGLSLMTGNQMLIQNENDCIFDNHLSIFRSQVFRLDNRHHCNNYDICEPSKPAYYKNLKFNIYICKKVKPD